MEKHYKEKHLQATIYKIENVKREQNFLIKNIWKVIGFGIALSILAPVYSPRSNYPPYTKRESLINTSQYSHFEIVLGTAILYLICCLIYHFVIAKIQDHFKLKKLNTLKSKLEKEIAEL